MLALNLQAQFSIPQYIDFCVRILVACSCGALIGLERSRRFKEAGIRTHIVVCCAAALMMLVSKYAYADLMDATGATLLGTKGADPSRIASQVVTGISFLGAGVIFKQKLGGSVKGLTTAAGLWATAGIGLAVGAGMYIMGLFTTFTMLACQIVLHHFNIGGDSLVSTHLAFILMAEETFEDELNAFLREHHMSISEMRISYLEDGAVAYDMVVRMPHNATVSSLNQFLRDTGHVRQLSYSSAGAG